MAHKKGGGTTRNGRDSESKRLGVKVYGGTLFALVNGKVQFAIKGASKHQYAIVVAA